MCSSWMLGTLLILKFRMDRSPLSLYIININTTIKKLTALIDGTREEGE